jgi:hypothetical protein
MSRIRRAAASEAAPRANSRGRDLAWAAGLLGALAAASCGLHAAIGWLTG